MSDIAAEPDEYLDEGGADDLSIAIIGLSGRVPGADDMGAFWESLVAGEELITHFSREELETAGVPSKLLDEPGYVHSSPILKRHPGQFDAAFFGYTPREARLTDPQHRLFLECAWEALEYAGYDADRCDMPISVFGGAAMNTYLMYSGLIPDFYDEYFPILLGNDNSYLATRVSFKLNLTGPSMTLQTACSSSLVAVHTACQSLLNEECDLALAGGASVRVPHQTGYRHREGSVASPDGRCRAFDAKAAGTLFGSGAGVVLLKRLSDAIADGDPITAVIRGTAVNNDGASKLDFTSPSVGAQAEVISQALASAGVSADSISYVEAHGTGTYLGDPIEVAALTRAFRKDTDQTDYCALGSVKTNIGHLDAAAGVIGLIKVALSLEHKQIPASLHFEEPNPQIAFAGSPFFVNAETRSWETPSGQPRRAGLSSLGIGGTNAHAVLEEAPAPTASSASRAHQLLLLSARSETALNQAALNLANHLENQPDLKLSDVAHTLQIGRKRFDHRRMVVCSDHQEAINLLSGKSPGAVSGEVRNEEPSIAFMFPGGGAQYCNMAFDLYQHEAVFRDEVERCFSLIPQDLATRIKGLLYPSEAPSAEALAELEKPSNALVALFTVEYALARLLMSFGLQPSAMIGHSVGEYAAACLAGLFSLEDALALVALRGRLFETLPEGSMASIPLPPDEVRGLMSDELSIAAINRTNLCVVSGPPPAVEALRAELAEREIDTARIHVSVAAHSKLVEPILDEFRTFIQGLELKTPKIPLVSNLTGDFVEPERVMDPEYWVRHLRETVNFADGVGQLVKDPSRALIEVGPGQTLATLARQHPEKSAGQVIAPTTRHPREETSNYTVLLDTLGKLWLAGSDIDWDGFYAHESRRRTPLPTYPFERQMFWMETGVDGLSKAESQQAIAQREAALAPTQSLANGAVNGVGSSTGDNPLLVKLKGMLNEVSGVEIADIDADATFAELGVDSLMMTQVTSALSRDFDFKIGPRELVQETPSLTLLAAHMEKAFPETWGMLAANGRSQGLSEAPAPGIPSPDTLAPKPNGQAQDQIAKLKAIVEDVTGHNAETIDPSASFVDLGVDSLMMTQLNTRIRKEFGIDLDLKELFGKATTLDALASHIQTETEGTAPAVVCNQVTESRVTAPVQSDLPAVASETDIANWFHTPSWVRAPLPSAEINRSAACWLLFADDQGVFAKLTEEIEARGETVVTVTRSTRFEQHDGQRFSIRPDAPGDYTNLIAALSKANLLPTDILHGWTHGLAPSNGSAENHGDVQACGFFSLLFMAQALGGASAERRLFILTSGLFAVNGPETIDPQKATLLGPCRVMPKEMPGLQCRLIDAPADGQKPSDQDLATLLLAEFDQETADQVIAYRGGERWREIFSPTPLPTADEASPRLKTSGIYLVTGGLGDVGEVITSHLAQTYRAKLVLVGRTELPPRGNWGTHLTSPDLEEVIGRKISQIQELEKLGAEVITISADVADRAEMEGVVRQAIERFGRLDGVIHAAGILNDGMILLKNQRDVEASFAAKIAGTLAIEAVTKDLDLDFVALFSSTHAVLAPPGQVAHSAANSFLDQFAQSRFDGSKPRFLTINWPVWNDISFVGVEGGPWLDLARASGIRAADGIDVFERVLQSPHPRVIVSPRNFADNLAFFRDFAVTTQSGSKARASSPQPFPAKPASTPTKTGEPQPTIRHAASGDIDAIVALLGEGFPNVTPDHWRGLFGYSWDPKRPNLGFVLVDGDDIVGFVGTIYSEREISGRQERICNGSAWYVRPDHRAHSMDLFLSFVTQRGYTITALTPNPISGPVLKALGFQVLEQAIRFLPPLFQAHTLLRGGLRLLTKPEEIEPHLSASDAQILRDHKAYACSHYLALSPEGSCYIVTRSRALYGIRFSEVLYVSNPEMMVRYLERIKLRIFLSEKALCLMSDERMFGGHKPLSFQRSRVRYFISDSLNADQIDHLYSEFVLVPETGRGRLRQNKTAPTSGVIPPPSPTVPQNIAISQTATRPVYAVAQGRIEDRALLDQYVARALPTIEAGGGRVVGFDEAPEIVEGDIEHPRTVILEFPSREAFRSWYESAEYKEIIPIRLEATPGTLIVVDSLAPPP